MDTTSQMLPKRLPNYSQCKLQSVRTRQTLHPVCRLQQIMQAKGQKNPTYTVEETTNEKKQISYTVTCTLHDGSSATSKNISKKRAKSLATEEILQKLGVADQLHTTYTIISTAKSCLKLEHDNLYITDKKGEDLRKVTFLLDQKTPKRDIYAQKYYR